MIVKSNESDEFGCVPAQAIMLRLALFIVAKENEIFVETLFMASMPVIGTTTAVLSTSGMLGYMLPAMIKKITPIVSQKRGPRSVGFTVYCESKQRPKKFRV